jgi:hypothetical protein
MAEPLPGRDNRQTILLYESAEGGAGVLTRLATEPAALASRRRGGAAHHALPAPRQWSLAAGNARPGCRRGRQADLRGRLLQMPALVLQPARPHRHRPPGCCERRQGTRHPLPPDSRAGPVGDIRPYTGAAGGRTGPPLRQQPRTGLAAHVDATAIGEVRTVARKASPTATPAPISSTPTGRPSSTSTVRTMTSRRSANGTKRSTARWTASGHYVVRFPQRQARWPEIFAVHAGLFGPGNDH